MFGYHHNSLTLAVFLSEQKQNRETQQTLGAGCALIHSNVCSLFWKAKAVFMLRKPQQTAHANVFRLTTTFT